MAEETNGAVREARRRLESFRADPSERLMVWPTEACAQAMGLCPCERSWTAELRMAFRGWVLEQSFRLPFSGFKCWLLRRFGARIGQNVYFAPNVWIDPLFPDLLTVEDDVLIGVSARILMHEFRIDEFQAGRVVIRKGALVGAWALIGRGVEIGEGATVAMGAVVRRNVPPGAMAIGNPAEIVRREPGEGGGLL